MVHDKGKGLMSVRGLDSCPTYQKASYDKHMTRVSQPG